MSFLSFGLSSDLLKALEKLAFKFPTPVQRGAISPALQGQDILGCAHTGTGKTLAYALPLLQLLNTDAPQHAQALVLLPTRELAVQVGETLRQLAQGLPQTVRISVVFGGVSINPQMMALRGGTHVLVATPGRLLDLVQHNAVKLDGIKFLVLDEADRLLELGFAQELNQVLALLPRRRQALFFSATFSPSVQTLARKLLHDPVWIDVRANTAPPADIKQQAIAVEAPQRTQLLRHLVKQHGWHHVLVFVATKFAAEIVADKLRKGGATAEPFHGELSQGKRTQVLNDFKAGRLSVVVATDLAARGLDIADLPVVVNFDLPRSASDYTHRVGRTGRNGQAGVAISFVSAENLAHWQLIAKRHRLQLALESVAGFAAKPFVAVSDSERLRDSNGGLKGKRPSKKDKLRAQQAQSGSTMCQAGDAA